MSQDSALPCPEQLNNILGYHHDLDDAFLYKEYILCPYPIHTYIKSYHHAVINEEVKFTIQLYAHIKCPTKISIDDMYMMYEKYDFPGILNCYVGTTWIFIIDSSYNHVHFQFPD